MFARRTAWELRPNRLAVALENYKRAVGKLLDLTASNPTQCGFRYDEPTLLAALANRDALQYHTEPKGLLSARAAVAEYYRERQHLVSGHAIGAKQPAPEARKMVAHGASRGLAARNEPSPGGAKESGVGPIDPDQIILTTSTSEAYSFVFRLLCDPGDEVLVPTPSYPLFEYLAGLQDVKLVPYGLFYDHGWHIDFHSLEEALTPRTRAIIVVHPNNPTGSYVKPREAAELNAICSGRSLALIADEVFLDYSLGSQQATFATNSDALTFTLSGISKISALPQMKLAWIVVSGPENDAAARTALERLELIADTYLSMSAPIQLAAPAFLAQRHALQPQLKTRVCANLAELDRQLRHVPHSSRASVGLPPGGLQVEQGSVTRLEIEGGWYAILRVPVTRSDEDLAIALLEKQHVLVQPGYFYDFHSDGYLVVSLITPEEEFTEGIRRLLAFIAS